MSGSRAPPLAMPGMNRCGLSARALSGTSLELSRPSGGRVEAGRALPSSRPPPAILIEFGECTEADAGLLLSWISVCFDAREN